MQRSEEEEKIATTIRISRLLLRKIELISQVCIDNKNDWDLLGRLEFPNVRKKNQQQSGFLHFRLLLRKIELISQVCLDNKTVINTDNVLLFRTSREYGISNVQKKTATIRICRLMLRKIELIS